MQVIQKSLAEGQLLTFQMLKGMTVHKILVEDFEKKELCPRIIPYLLMRDQKYISMCCIIC
jgi:hypothetical protein